MPVLKRLPVRPWRRALIVGNGPSSHAIAWPAVARWVASNRGSWPDAFLINRVALGPKAGAFSVAVGPEVVEEYRAARLWERSRVVSNCPWKVVGPERFERTFGEILTSPGSIFAPEEWPPNASGPLATWVASWLGYAEVILWGLDGTAGPPQEASDWLYRARCWEASIVRAGEEMATLKTGQRIVRAWPSGLGVTIDRDPLQSVLSESCWIQP